MESAFQSVMAEAGLEIRGSVIADGKLHRISVKGDKPGSKNGWYVLYGDGVPSGAYGSWKTGINGKWCAKAQDDLTPSEREEHKRRMDEAKKAREAEDQAIKKAAREKAVSI